MTTVLTIILLGALVSAVLLYLLPARYEARSPLRDDSNQELSKDGARDQSPKSTVQVLVLGDIGRSPRMQYHAISIAKHGGVVELIGYRESDPHPDLLSSPLVSITAIPPPPRLLRTENKLLFLVYGPLKVLWQVWSLWLILGYRTKAARWLLVQNPPSIPSLAIAYLVCLIRDTHLLIDWHNFGWSILAMRLGEAHPLVSVAKRYESFFGGFASANFTVTDAMARVLKEDFHIASPILTLHDRPPAHFQPLSPSQRASFLARLPETAPHAQDILAGRTKLLVSATSWTADEDFSILLDALISYSASTTATTAAHLPQILAIITGKGPQKAHYLSQISSHTRSGLLRNIIVQTAWLSAADYASLLGSADLGVSLHTSSSGVDLPMKVVDMFGAGLPVVGWSDFEAWKELVREGQNGRGFQSAQQLADVLRDLFAVELALMGDRAAGAGGAWERNAELKRLKEGTMKEGAHRWEDEWVPVAGRILGLCD